MNIGPIIASLYSGNKFTFNIVSFVDKILSIKLIFDEEKIDEDSKKIISCFSIKNKIPPTESIPISFTVPTFALDSKCKNYKLKGNLEMEIEESEIEPLSIRFTFNVNLLPLEIIFKNFTESMFWDENRLVLISNSFEEGKILKFKYIIRNFNENLSLETIILKV